MDDCLSHLDSLRARAAALAASAFATRSPASPNDSEHLVSAATALLDAAAAAAAAVNAAARAATAGQQPDLLQVQSPFPVQASSPSLTGLPRWRLPGAKDGPGSGPRREPRGGSGAAPATGMLSTLAEQDVVSGNFTPLDLEAGIKVGDKCTAVVSGIA